MFGLLKKSKPLQDDIFFPFKTVSEKEQLIFRNKKQFAANRFDFVQKKKRQNMSNDDEKRVRNGDRPFTKAKRTSCDMLDQKELQTYASLEKMLHKAIHAIRQLKKKGNTNTSHAPKQQINFSSLSNYDLKTNVLSSDKSKAVKPTSKAHSTRCFKCHMIGHYANKCKKQKPLVTLEEVETEPEKEGLSDPLPIFDDYPHKPKEGSDDEQNRGHQTNQEGSSSIHKPDRTQGEPCLDYGSFAYNPFPFNVSDLRTNLFEEGEYDRTKIKQHPFWFMDTVQDGDHVDQFDPTGIFPSDRDTTLELDELSEISDTTMELDELSDTNLELNELCDTEEGAGLAARRNEPFSAHRKIHNKFNLGPFYTKFDQAFPNGLLPICIKKYQENESKSWHALISSKTSQKSTSRFYKSL